jgi:UDP-N-acetyl-D-mannosaminuronic acid dehydrogenase
MGCTSDQGGIILSQVIIVGAGYVGLTLGVASAKVGHEVFFVDINVQTVEKLNQRIPMFYESGLQESLEILFKEREHIAFTSMGALLQYTKLQSTIFVISLGTPLGSDSKALLGPVVDVTREVASHMTHQDLIVLRSTVAVGTSRYLLTHIPEITNLSFCPERTIEGKALEELCFLPQIISGNTPPAERMAHDYFSTITSSVVKAANLETAELIKLASNSFRDLNFAFANLLALISQQHNVNVNELISLANFRYDRNKIALPGLVGGPCLEKDSYILSQSFTGKEVDLLIDARHLNEAFPSQAMTFMKRNGVSKCTKVLVCGAAFKGKPITSDTRGSFVFEIVEGLQQLGVQNDSITILDPKVSELIHGINVVNSPSQADVKYDYMIQLTNHDFFDTQEFDEFVIKHCTSVISFWPKSVGLNSSSAKHLFLGGLRPDTQSNS